MNANVETTLLRAASAGSVTGGGGAPLSTAQLARSWGLCARGGPRERTIVYEAPFDRCDREQGYEVASRHFQKRSSCFHAGAS